MPAQLIATNGLAARLLCEWMLRAINSLPVPLSPRISTVESVGAILRINPRIERIAGEGAMISGNIARASMLPSTSVTRLNVLAMGVIALSSLFRRSSGGMVSGTNCWASRKKRSTGLKINQAINRAHRNTVNTSNAPIMNTGHGFPPATGYFMRLYVNTAASAVKPAKISGTNR